MSDVRQELQATLSGTYTLARELGGGGMSRVFLATEDRLHRSVVIKVLSGESAAGVSAERFEREIKVIASLQQANIVPLLAAGETNGIPYYTMPFVEGESLRARLSKDGRLPIADATSILRDVARALSYAHSHGVVHRDIKPDNILLSHGAAVVSDFGIAKAISAARTLADGALTQSGTAIGTPAYMAPEQVSGDPNIDHRADVYAFGCVAYELLTGRPPFANAIPHKVLAAHISARPESLLERRTDTPATLAALVMQCLEKDPAQRPQTAADLLRSLDAVSTPHDRTFVAPRPPRRRPLVIAAVLLVVLSGLFIAKGFGGPRAEQSIAVLPLANLSGDKADDYFGEGLAEEMTSALAKAGVRVIGRGSARALAARGLDAREIAKQLGVTTVLQGNVQRAAGQLRISVTLTSASDGSVMWSEKYDRQLKDVFAVQDEIARSVAGQLSATLAGGGAPLVRNETADPEAHALYLQGLYLWNRRTAPTLRRAIGLFQQAVARDPTYGRAHAGIALANAVLPTYEDGDAGALQAAARAAADRALLIDSSLTEAWTAMAHSGAYQWQNADAEFRFQRALRADSSFATTHFWYALMLAHTGRLEEAQRRLERAFQLEPASLVISANFGIFMALRRQFDSAVVSSRAAAGLDSTFAVGRYVYGAMLMMAGKNADAIQVLSGVAPQTGLRQSQSRGTLALAYARAGRSQDARRVIGEIRSANKGSLPPTAIIAATLMQLGDTEAAIKQLKLAIDSYDPWILNFGASQFYDQLRADPRGRALLEKTEAR